MTPDEIARDAQLLNDAVREGAAVALQHFTDGTKSWDKRPGDPVSDADLAVDALLKDRLMGARPDYGWLSEETPDGPDRLTRDRVWMVDPIDGTRAFLKGRPEFTVCAGLVENGRPVAGTVCNPAADEFFEAQLGAGARLNGETISVGGGTRLTNARILASPRPSRLGKNNETDSESPFGQAQFASVNSIAYRIVLVALGRFDATISLQPKSDWDIAAAELILQEAGGVITDRSGAPYSYNREDVRHTGVIAAAPDLHAEILGALAAT